MSTVGSADPAALQSALLAWFVEGGRDLPWRRTRDPYRVLVSEIMLQQTQVERVIPKYLAFLAAFPTLEDLAAAPTAEVIRLWAGLGYNRRAVNLQRAARVVRDEHGGAFPRDVEALRRLPGVGPYTAGAVACFAFEQDVAFVDTNIRRVLRRACVGPGGVGAEPGDRELLAIGQSLVPAGQGWAWNQAIMELGALVCTAAAPACRRCPIKTHCRTYGAMAAEDEALVLAMGEVGKPGFPGPLLPGEGRGKSGGRGSSTSLLPGEGEGRGKSGGRGSSTPLLPGEGEGRGESGGRGSSTSLLPGEGEGRGKSGGRGSSTPLLSGEGEGRGESGGRGSSTSLLSGEGRGDVGKAGFPGPLGGDAPAGGDVGKAGFPGPLGGDVRAEGGMGKAGFPGPLGGDARAEGGMGKPGFPTTPLLGARARRVAERREEPYVGSRRWYRGRIVEALRGLPAGEAHTLAELGPMIRPGFTPEDLPWLRELVAGLARDGLLALAGDSVQLP